MFQQLLQQSTGGGQWIIDGAHRLVAQPQLLPSAGEIPVDGRRHLPEPFDEVGPVVDEHGPGLGHAQIELIQSVQQRGMLLPVPQNPGLMFIKTPVFRQSLGVPGPQLTDAVVQEPAAHRGPLPDKPQIFRAEEHGVEYPRQLPGGL